MKHKTARLTLRTTEEAKDILSALAEHHGVSRTSVVEIALREKASRDGVRSVSDDPDVDDRQLSILNLPNGT